MGWVQEGGGGLVGVRISPPPTALKKGSVRDPVGGRRRLVLGRGLQGALDEVCIHRHAWGDSALCVGTTIGNPHPNKTQFWRPNDDPPLPGAKIR